jgi:glycogen synthase
MEQYAKISLKEYDRFKDIEKKYNKMKKRKTVYTIHTGIFDGEALVEYNSEYELATELLKEIKRLTSLPLLKRIFNFKEKI